MRNALLITIAAILLIIYLRLENPVESPAPSAQTQFITQTPAAPTPLPSPPFPDWRPQNATAAIDPLPQDQEYAIHAPSIPAVGSVGRAAAPRVDPQRTEAAPRPTSIAARPIYVGVVGSQDDAGFEQDDSDWQRGTLTLQGGFSYYPAQEPATAAMARVTIAATLDCQSGKGVLYYRDPAEGVEWLSSEFAFNAKAVCISQQEGLDALATEFNANIAGAYAPLTINDFSAIQGGGLFALRLVSSETAAQPQSAVKLCLALQGGTYQHYVLPQNPGNWSLTPQCTFLNSFTLQRNP